MRAALARLQSRVHAQVRERHHQVFFLRSAISLAPDGRVCSARLLRVHCVSVNRGPKKDSQVLLLWDITPQSAHATRLHKVPGFEMRRAGADRLGEKLEFLAGQEQVSTQCVASIVDLEQGLHRSLPLQFVRKVS